MSTEKNPPLPPDDAKALFKKAQNYITDGKVEKAIKLLLGYKDIIDPKFIFSEISHRWESLEDKILRNLLTSEQSSVQKNNIAHDLLLSMVAVETDYLKSLTKKPPETVISPPLNYVKTAEKTHIVWLYGTEDKEAKAQLKKYFFQLLRNKKLTFVDIHTDLPKGIPNVEGYQKQIIETADVVLCLVTENILTFPAYEWAEIAASQEKLIPVRIREIDTIGTVFETNTRGLPTDGSFVTEHENPSKVFAEIARSFTAFIQSNF